MGKTNRFAGELLRDGRAVPVEVTVTAESLVFATDTGSETLNFCHLRDMRLLNYHLLLDTDSGVIELQRFGLETENLFEKLWLAYDARSRQALFLNGAPERESEGTYAYREGTPERHSTAKAALYPDSLCILPHDAGARRVPLCFADEPKIEGYTATLTLDTGEMYQIGRLGHDTLPFFDQLCVFRSRAVKAWQQAHEQLAQHLAQRLGDLNARYEILSSLDANMACGLFAPEDENFWFAAVAKDRAAVELSIGEAAATYLYRFDTSPEVFLRSLRHAMEAVGSHREVIYLPDEELQQQPLLCMAVDRSAHVRFLRRCNAGRIVHNTAWEQHLHEFFQN